MRDDSEKRPLLVNYYERYLVDQDIDAYVCSVSASYTTGCLQRLAEVGSRTARRGAVLGLGRLGDYRANMTLGRALIDSDRGVRTLAENGIRSLWMRVGVPSVQRHLAAIEEHLEEKQYDRAAQLATGLAEDSPWIAQAWYFRGKAFFHLEQYEAATRDCHQALEINAYHFLAASVMGQAYLLTGDLVSALESFRRALRLNPNMEEVRAQVIHLQRNLKGE
ncbi:MAG: tetratricopeptide repeat protein [Planctomycetales bacterium]|nr:tetratricopeptide repeat protein [Planctomycetales bacterium]